MPLCLAAILRRLTPSALRFCALILFVLAAPSCASAATYYVSPAGSDSNTGTSAAPLQTIRKAINTSASGDTVLIADGTYTGPGDVDLDFGGRNITVMSVNGPASTIIDCQGGSSASHRGFYLHSGETNAVISGLTVQNGYVDGSGFLDPLGGGMLIYGVGATIQNCVLRNNTAHSSGGGIFSYGASTGVVTLNGCTITDNTALAAGGGLYDSTGGSSAVIVMDCFITGNTSPNGGGVENTNGGDGGAITLTNCAIVGNANGTNGGAGGGVYNYNSGSNGAISLVNCTITGNAAAIGGGILDATGYNAAPITLINDIVYGDTGGEIYDSFIPSAVSFSDIQGGYRGAGNLNADPLFVSATDLHLQPGSPCLGAAIAIGASATTIEGYARPNPPSIGAYELSPNSTAVIVTNATGSAGQTIMLSAMFRTGAGVAPSGRTLTFSVDGMAVGSAVTNSGGTAGLKYTVPASLAVGGHTLTATFAGAILSGTGTLTVAAPATTVFVSTAAGSPGQTVTLRAALKRTVGGTAVAGETVTFSVDGTTFGTAVTTGAGLASLNYVIPAGDAIGSSHPLTAAFAGDGSVKASSGSSSLTVTKYATGLPVSAVTGTPGRTVMLSATLKRSVGGAAVSGETVTFTVDGTTVGTGVTNANGVATLAYAIPAGNTIGSHPVTAIFVGDASSLAATGKGTLTVRNATALSVANVSGAHGTSVTLSATLTAGSAVVSGKTLTFKVDGKAFGTAVTDGSGVATLTYAIPSGDKVGTHGIGASFAGDAGDTPAVGTEALTVS